MWMEYCQDCRMGTKTERELRKKQKRKAIEPENKKLGKKK